MAIITHGRVWLIKLQAWSILFRVMECKNYSVCGFLSMTCLAEEKSQLSCQVVHCINAGGIFIHLYGSKSTKKLLECPFWHGKLFTKLLLPFKIHCFCCNPVSFTFLCYSCGTLSYLYSCCILSWTALEVSWGIFLLDDIEKFLWLPWSLKYWRHDFVSSDMNCHHDTSCCTWFFITQTIGA